MTEYTWAELADDDTVLRVIVCAPDPGTDGTVAPKFCTDTLGGRWVRTYQADPDATYAAEGFTWDPHTDDFVAPVQEPDPTPRSTP